MNSVHYTVYSVEYTVYSVHCRPQQPTIAFQLFFPARRFSGQIAWSFLEQHSITRFVKVSVCFVSGWFWISFGNWVFFKVTQIQLYIIITQLQSQPVKQTIIPHDIISLFWLKESRCTPGLTEWSRTQNWEGTKCRLWYTVCTAQCKVYSSVVSQGRKSKIFPGSRFWWTKTFWIKNKFFEFHAEQKTL